MSCALSGVTQVTYYRWRREFGGLQLDQVKRMKELEVENQRLRKAVSTPATDGSSGAYANIDAVYSTALGKVCFFSGIERVHVQRGAW